MSKKLLLVFITVLFFVNTEAPIPSDVFDAFNYLDAVRSSITSTVFGDDDLIKEHRNGFHEGPSEDKKTNRDSDFHTHDEIRDDFSFQTAILRIRLKAAKQFIENRTRFLKHTEANSWEINGLLLTFKRKDVEGAKSDIKLIEEALENPSKFKDLIIDSSSNEKKDEDSRVA
ncbi:uncharacterized protein LOC135844224 [Planococcus citri]|uniref:uncharacterized protein LOC135844224 n=1 Tax=Planococcus citri TaxID=170843 RepID=UPI0031F81DF4